MPFRLQGISVTLNCASTGLAATRWDKDKVEWVSGETYNKRKAVEAANQRLHNYFKDYMAASDAFPLDFDELGGREGESHIAVVHADGNSVGERFRHVIRGKALEQAATSLRQLSLSVAHAGQTALGKVVARLSKGLNDGSMQAKGLDFRWKGNTRLLPIRPLIYGGDDVTLVCDGRLGLAIAAMYLREFNRCKADDGKALHACAGICIVRSHFPFGRAYALAAETTRTAKIKAREVKDNSKQASSWLDFHIALAGVAATLEEIRHTDYTAADGGSLLWRPWCVVSPEGSALKKSNWQLFEVGIQQFQKGSSRDKTRNGSEKTWPRGRAKGLRGALFEGQASTRNAVSAARSRGLDLPPIDTSLTDGWTSSVPARTPYFDLLESLDFYIPLETNDDNIHDSNQNP